MKFKNINIFNFLRSKKTHLVFLAVFVLFIAPFSAKAQFFEWISGKAIGGAFYYINVVLGYIAGVIFNLGGALVNFALNLNSEILNKNSNVFMSTGWNIILGFADLALILAIIVIAFATILRIESYGMKKTLWRLIVAALLVNFSLVIAGVFIDAAGIVTDFFVGKSTGISPTNMATILASVFDVQRMIEVDPGTFKDNPLASFSSALLIAIASTLFICIFTIIAAIVLFAIFIMFLSRYVVLSVLLIFSPLVLVAWIFPATQGLFKQWWQKFMQWTFFAPICTFFLYLSIVGLQKTGAGSPAQLFKSSNLTKDALGSFSGPLLQAIGQMVMAVGLLIASLIVAQKMGINGASAAVGWTQSVGKGIQKGIQKGAWRGATRVTGAGPTRTLATRMAASRIAPVRWAARGLGVLGTKAETEATKQYREEAKGYTTDRLNNEILASRGVRKNVLLEHAAKNKKIKKEVFAQVLTDPNKMELMEKEFRTQGLDFKSVTKATGYDAKTLKAAQSGDENVMLAAAKEFHSGLKPDDYKNWQGQVLYSDSAEKDLGIRTEVVNRLRKSVAHGIGQESPGVMYKLFPNMKTGEITTFADSMYNEAMKELPVDFKNKDINEKKKWIEENTEIGKALKKSKGQRLYGETKEEKIEKEEEPKKDERKEKK